MSANIHPVVDLFMKTVILRGLEASKTLRLRKFYQDNLRLLRKQAIPGSSTQHHQLFAC